MIIIFETTENKFWDRVLNNSWFGIPVIVFCFSLSIILGTTNHIYYLLNWFTIIIIYKSIISSKTIIESIKFDESKNEFEFQYCEFNKREIKRVASKELQSKIVSYGFKSPGIYLKFVFSDNTQIKQYDYKPWVKETIRSVFTKIEDIKKGK